MISAAPRRSHSARTPRANSGSTGSWSRNTSWRCGVAADRAAAAGGDRGSAGPGVGNPLGGGGGAAAGGAAGGARLVGGRLDRGEVVVLEPERVGVIGGRRARRLGRQRPAADAVVGAARHE